MSLQKSANLSINLSQKNILVNWVQRGVLDAQHSSRLLNLLLNEFPTQAQNAEGMLYVLKVGLLCSKTCQQFEVKTVKSILVMVLLKFWNRKKLLRKKMFLSLGKRLSRAARHRNNPSNSNNYFVLKWIISQRNRLLMSKWLRPSKF